MNLSNLKLSEKVNTPHYTKLPKPKSKQSILGNKITISQDRMSLTVGLANIPVWKHIHPTVCHNISLLYEMCYGVAIDKNIYILDIDKFYKQFVKRMKISPSSVLSSIRKFQFAIMCCELHNRYLYACCTYNNSKVLNDTLLRSYIQSDEIRKICQQDNQLNLLPLCITHLLTPHQLKQQVSSSTWKKLCHNSLTRNSNMRDIPIRFLNQCIDYPTEFLRKRSDLVSKSFWDPDIDKIIKLLKKSKLVTSKRCDEILNIIFDTQYMASQLGVSYNINWSVNRWMHQHTIFTRLVNAQQYSSVPFSHRDLAHLDSTIKYNEYTATLLTSELDVAMEGIRMHHCIASYAKRCGLGEYVAYSIINNVTKQRSTLGFPTIKWNGQVSFIRCFERSQHVVYDNDPVDFETKQFGDLIIQHYVDKKLGSNDDGN